MKTTMKFGLIALASSTLLPVGYAVAQDTEATEEATEERRFGPITVTA